MRTGRQVELQTGTGFDPLLVYNKLTDAIRQESLWIKMFTVNTVIV